MLYAAGIGNQSVNNPRDAEDGKRYRRPANQAKAFGKGIEGARESLLIQQDAHGANPDEREQQEERRAEQIPSEC